MKRLPHHFIVASALIGLFAGASVATAFAPKGEPQEPLSPVTREWSGGPVSLPIGGDHLAPEILAAAYGLAQAQELQSLFNSRGYIRRLDLDKAGGNDSLSFAILAWQKPGVPVEQEMPIIRLISKYHLDPGIRVRVADTQAFGGVVRDSAGTLTTYDSGLDAPAAVVEMVPVGTAGSFMPEPGKLPQTQDDVWAYRFSYRETRSGAAKAAVQQVWQATCGFRRGVVRLGLVYGGIALARYATGPLGLVYGTTAIWAAEQWIDSNWKCE